jgi:hypothetical protein
VRQVDQVHNAEDQRQPGGEQEQQHAELHAVEKLLDEIEHGPVAVFTVCASCLRSSRASTS